MMAADHAEETSEAGAVDNNGFLYSWYPLVDVRVPCGIRGNTSPSGACVQEYVRVLLSRAYIHDHDLMALVPKEERTCHKTPFAPVPVASSSTKKFSKELNSFGCAHSFDESDSSSMTGMAFTGQVCSKKMSPEIFKNKEVMERSKIFERPINKFLTPEDAKKENMKEEEKLCDFFAANKLSAKEFDFVFRLERDLCLLMEKANVIFSDKNDFKKRWAQRFRFFSKIGQETPSWLLMDYGAWLTAVPERVAAHVADRIRMSNSESDENFVVLDAFAHVGANSIQLALAGAFVIALESDPIKLRCARQNARVYGVADRIEFICADFCEFAEAFVSRNHDDASGGDEQRRLIYAVFLCPSLGGSFDSKVKSLDFVRDIRPDGQKLYLLAKKITPNIVFYLPRNINIRQLFELTLIDSSSLVEGRSTTGRVRLEIEQAALNSHQSYALHAYYGALAASPHQNSSEKGLRSQVVAGDGEGEVDASENRSGAEESPIE